MPFLQRDSSGQVTALFAEAPAEDAEFAQSSHPDVVAFLDAGTERVSDEDARRQLAAMDGSMIRVLEDLLDVLIQKHIILLTDLPLHAQRKLLSRKEARGNLLGDAAGMSPPVKEIF
ncbi:MAG: hypothetical protein JWQ23_1318 [Herminiimonas sp.]|jgi:hypothetical protein|nr:hypothetical protein [Herminiimonas sp.]